MMDVTLELYDFVVVMHLKHTIFRIFHKKFRQLDDQLPKF